MLPPTIFLLLLLVFGLQELSLFLEFEQQPGIVLLLSLPFDFVVCSPPLYLVGVYPTQDILLPATQLIIDVVCLLVRKVTHRPKPLSRYFFSMILF